ncbi:MAG: ankyrin repeat domain-containing protein [Verrucomicrobiota bacterium]|nr:ankyrin repeat domain-containing protein [Verrucomicrobiota bacterium]
MKHILFTITAVMLLVGCVPLESTFFSIHDAAKDGDVDSVKKFLDQGVDINSQAGKWGNTPLHEAAFLGNVEVVRLLISKEANVDAKDYYGCTPLHDAVDYGNLEILELLLGKNTYVNALNEDGQTPLDLASLKNTAKLLRKHGGKTGQELKTARK